MAHKFEHTEELLGALQHPGTSSAVLTLESTPIPQPTIDFDTVGQLIYGELDKFATLLSRTIPLSLDGQFFDTSNYYHQNDTKMLIFSLRSTDPHAPVPLSHSSVASLNILEMYRTTELSTEDLAKIIIEKRPTAAGHAIEALIKSHGETPATITNQIQGSLRIISRSHSNPNESDTTVKIATQSTEDTHAFADRVSQAIETTAAGIIAHYQSQTRQVRQNLLNAA